jgi:hypothetical protein
MKGTTGTTKSTFKVPARHDAGMGEPAAVHRQHGEEAHFEEQPVAARRQRRNQETDRAAARRTRVGVAAAAIVRDPISTITR